MNDSKVPSSRPRLLILALLIITIFVTQAFYLEKSFAGHVESYSDIYCTQMGSGKCTLASCVMMMRSKAKSVGDESWEDITQSDAISAAWIGGRGLKHEFSYKDMTVTYGEFDGDRKDSVISMLEDNPEGIEIYERSLPHAIFLTRYDESEDVFYCADPALGSYEMTLAESWLRKAASGSDTGSVQSSIINNLDAYWYISNYDGVVPEEVEEDVPKVDPKTIKMCSDTVQEACFAPISQPLDINSAFIGIKESLKTGEGENN